MDELHNDIRAMRVYALLIETARRCGVVTYNEVADAAGMKATGSQFASFIGGLFYQINEAEHAAGRPMLSALVVNKRPASRTKSSKKGLCACARSLGLLGSADSDKAVTAFIARQQREAHRTWA